MIDYKKQGKKNRTSGSVFELRVRKDLESQGFIVSKWMNTVEFGKGCGKFGGKYGEGELKCGVGGYLCEDCKKGKLIPAKHKFRGPGIPMAIGTGFPDFVAFRNQKGFEFNEDFEYAEVMGVESKSNGKLDKAEKEKCKWLLDNKIFSKILIASKTKVKNRIVVEYEGFK